MMKCMVLWGLLLSGCQPEGTWPASLQIVPAGYYSTTPVNYRHGRARYETPPPPLPPSAASKPTEIIIPETKAAVERMEWRARELRNVPTLRTPELDNR